MYCGSATLWVFKMKNFIVLFQRISRCRPQLFLFTVTHVFEQTWINALWVQWQNGKCVQERLCAFSLIFNSFKPIVDYIDTQFENYLQEELKIKRSLFNYHDTRIHVCLYFIAPTGHSLKSLDLVTMKKLDSKVKCSK